MAELTVAMTYGNALFQAASEIGKKEIILEEAKAVLDIFKAEKDFESFVNAPNISAFEKKEVMQKVFGETMSRELLNFMMILVDKGRMKHFPQIVRIFEDLFDDEKGVAYGKIYSVLPLTPKQLEDFEAETSKLTRENVKLENEIDTSLIGGVKILIDGKIIDASIKKRISDMTDSVM